MSRNAKATTPFKEARIMTVFSRTPAGLITSATFMVGLLCAANAVTYAQRGQPITNQRVVLINTQTGKCLTIAGGRSTDNNAEGSAIRLRR